MVKELAAAIRYIAKQQGVKSVDFEKDVILNDDGEGAYVKEWNLDIPLPGNEALVIAEEAIEAEKASLAYIELRIAAYPDIIEQLDTLFWDLKNKTTVWIDTIAAIKEKYPKP